MGLVGIQPVVDIISLTLQTAFIKNSKTPLSLLLVSDPESAKTSAINYFSNLDFVSYHDEITAKQMIDKIIPAVKTGKCKYVVIPDLINCIDKQRSTRDQFLNTLKSAIDDTGIKSISTAYKSVEVQKGEEGIRFGLITAITNNNLRTIKSSIIRSGLLSRFIPFSYKYPIDKVLAIFDYINNPKKKIDHIKVPVINHHVTDVTGTKELYDQLREIAIIIGQEYQGYGIRAQINLKRLAEANALLHKRNRINQSDIDRIKELSKWMNYKFEVI